MRHLHGTLWWHKEATRWEARRFFQKVAKLPRMGPVGGSQPLKSPVRGPSKLPLFRLCAYLALQSLQNHSTPASCGGIAALTFVEVKARRSAAELDHAIDQRRLARVAAAAEVLMPRYATAGEDIRVDVVLLAPGTRPRHIENAWIGY